MRAFFLKEPHPYLSWFGFFCTVTGLTIASIYNFFNSFFVSRGLNPNRIIAVFILIAMIILIMQKIKLNKKDQEIDELNNVISACKKAIKIKIDAKEDLTPVDYYLVDKDVYDSFRTELKISKCKLEVELIKSEKKTEKHALNFKWKLKVKNPTDKKINMAKFIYSGIKGRDVPVHVTTENVRLDDHTLRTDIEVLGDDCFMDIWFSEDFGKGRSAIIYIDYTLEYDFKREKDCIWLVPDALGFSDMDKFCIRFYCDGEIIQESTRVGLRSYKLNTEYRPLEVKWINCETFDDNGRKGFEAKRSKKETLHGYGFRLELINDSVNENQEGNW